MLDALMKFGGHRIDYFLQARSNLDAFGFYVCGGLGADCAYSLEAKHQLYFGLALIQSQLGLKNLVAIYIDVNDVNNLQRPAYVQLKQDLINGLFRRVLILDEAVLAGNPAAEADLATLSEQVNGFELFTCLAGKINSIHIQAGNPPLAV